MVTSRLDELRPEDLSAAGHPTSYDLVVCVGNVMVLLAPDTERTVLANLAALLTDDARLLVGFHLRDAPAPTARSYPVDGVRRRLRRGRSRGGARFAGYDLRPFTEDGDYAVHVLRRVPSDG